jgi:hypothetical protein
MLSLLKWHFRLRDLRSGRAQAFSRRRHDGVKPLYFSEGREGFVFAIVEMNRVSIELAEGLR